MLVYYSLIKFEPFVEVKGFVFTCITLIDLM